MESCFELPEIRENPGGWGPASDDLPDSFKDVPYAPFSKSDKLGRVADWAQLGEKDHGRENQGNRNRTKQKDLYQAYGSGLSTFGYLPVEEEGSFSMVDNRTTSQQRKAQQFRTTTSIRGARTPGVTSFQLRNAGQQKRQGQFQRLGNSGSGGQQGNQGGGGGGGPKNVRSNFQQNPQATGKDGRRDWKKAPRVRESSIKIGADWEIVEEIEFNRLGKLLFEVDQGEDLELCGDIPLYDKQYDRISVKTEKPLSVTEKSRPNLTTSEDPVIQKLAKQKAGNVFATDNIISMLMCATRSWYPWDIIITIANGNLFLDKRDGGCFDFCSVNENAAEPPEAGEKETAGKINSAGALSLEATQLQLNLLAQVLSSDRKDFHSFENPNPFVNDYTNSIPTAYRYRRFNLSLNDGSDCMLILRTEIDGAIPTPQGAQWTSIKALNEFDPKVATPSLEWRQKLESQRGAVIATEMKNNSCKMARWAVQAILAGLDHIKLGYVSRTNYKDASSHVVLGMQSFKPKDLAAQMNLNLENCWGIVRAYIDLCFQLSDGKYVMTKDPNKPMVRIYSVPNDDSL